MKVGLKGIKHYFLTTDTNGERKKHMVDVFREYDLTEVNPIIDENRFKSGAVGFSRMIDLALRNQDRNKPFQPFILYEDDCSKYREFPEYIEVPDDSDVVYIGISVGCMHDNENESYAGCYFKIVNDDIVRIYNMLSMHGIMVCSASGALAIQKAVLECYYKGLPWDIYVAYIQPYYNVYALKTPLVYQDARYGGQEYPTRFSIDLNYYLPLPLPKEYINTTGLSIITCANPSNYLIINNNLTPPTYFETSAQRNQDRFAIQVLNFKRNGTFLDFGCRAPIECNNTYILEKKFMFSGLSFDIDEYEISKWKNSDRNYNNVICCDLLNYDFEKKIDEFYNSNLIDYFSFDLEPPLLTLEVLKRIPFDKYKFGVITFEHDAYRDFDTVRPSREIFIKNGYKKVKTEVMRQFEIETIQYSEDWWIHPDLVFLPEELLETNIDFDENEMMGLRDVIIAHKLGLC